MQHIDRYKNLNTLSRMKRVAKGRHWYDGSIYDYSYCGIEEPFFAYRHQKKLWCYSKKKKWVGELPF